MQKEEGEKLKCGEIARKSKGEGKNARMIYGNKTMENENVRNRLRHTDRQTHRQARPAYTAEGEKTSQQTNMQGGKQKNRTEIGQKWRKVMKNGEVTDSG